MLSCCPTVLLQDLHVYRLWSTSLSICMKCHFQWQDPLNFAVQLVYYEIHKLVRTNHIGSCDIRLI